MKSNIKTTREFGESTIDDTFSSRLYLWDKRTLYVGALCGPLEVSQGAATLLLALNRPITFKTKGMSNTIECRSLLLPAGLNIEIDVGDAIVANCNLDALGSDYFVLSSLMKDSSGGALFNLKEEEKYIHVGWKIYTSDMSSSKVYEYIDQLWSAESVARYSVDQRIEDVIQLIKQTVDDNLSVEELARAVNLSVPRLVQLFKLQTGVPIRRYRLWHRLYVTAVQLGKGVSLTDAAIAAGFTDSSHCSHTFRSMLGIKPSQMLSQSSNIRLIPPST